MCCAGDLFLILNGLLRLVDRIMAPALTLNYFLKLSGLPVSVPGLSISESPRKDSFPDKHIMLILNFTRIYLVPLQMLCLPLFFFPYSYFIRDVDGLLDIFNRLLMLSFTVHSVLKSIHSNLTLRFTDNSSIDSITRALMLRVIGDGFKDSMQITHYESHGLQCSKQYEQQQ